MRPRSLPLLLAALLATAASQAQAADIAAEAPLVTEVTTQEGWIVTLKGTGFYKPKFEGSGKYGVSGFPTLSVRRAGQVYKFGAPDDGFGFALINTDWIQIGPVARVRGERDTDRDRKFRGMGHVDYAIEPGVFAEVYPLEFMRVRGELRHGFWGHDGIVGNVSADFISRVDAVTFSVGPRMEFGDSDFMRTYYGVTDGQALRNGNVAQYKPDGGVKSVGAAAALTYQFTPNWSATAFGGYNRLVGEAADSPVARKLGSKNAYNVGLGVAYSFNWSGWGR